MFTPQTLLSAPDRMSISSLLFNFEIIQKNRNKVPIEVR